MNVEKYMKKYQVNEIQVYVRYKKDQHGKNILSTNQETE